MIADGTVHMRALQLHAESLHTFHLYWWCGLGPFLLHFGRDFEWSFAGILLRDLHQGEVGRWWMGFQPESQANQLAVGSGSRRLSYPAC
jgi:hypothetical protein